MKVLVVAKPIILNIILNVLKQFLKNIWICKLVCKSQSINYFNYKEKYYSHYVAKRKKLLGLQCLQLSTQKSET